MCVDLFWLGASFVKTYETLLTTSLKIYSIAQKANRG